MKHYLLTLSAILLITISYSCKEKTTTTVEGKSTNSLSFIKTNGTKLVDDTGTEIILNISEDSTDFLEEFKIRELLKKYARFMSVPIQFGEKELEVDISKEGEDPKLEKRLNPIEAGKRIKNYLTTLTLELQTLARANGKSDVRNLEPEDLAALTVEAAAMARVPLAGTDWIPGKK